MPGLTPSQAGFAKWLSGQIVNLVAKARGH
jgi:hypothetical protein